MAFPPAFLDELNARNPIEDVVGQYVALTRRGSNLFGLCPFHGEKTPSFSVAPEKGIFYCFGCHKGGGVVNFIMEIENLTYGDAVRFLAKRAGLEVPDDGAYQSQYKKKERLWALCRAAAQFYHAQLKTPAGEEARAYLQKRGVSGQTVTRFGLGYSPNRWTALLDVMTAKGYTKEELLEAGLLSQNRDKGTLYDRFRNRLMFPIIDVRGNVIGFGGRVMDDSTPKYLNSPETIIFNKRRNLFAMNVVKKSKREFIILTEGYMDAIALHQYGFDCAVASLGTSLTQEHADMLSKYTDELVLTYDGDEAGQNATQRAIPMLERTGLRVRILRMRGAKDPDEFLKKYGADRFRLLLEGCENQAEYRLRSLQMRFDLSQDEQKVEFAKQAAALIAGFGTAVEREVYGTRAAEAAGRAAHGDRPRPQAPAAAGEARGDAPGDGPGRSRSAVPARAALRQPPLRRGGGGAAAHAVPRACSAGADGGPDGGGFLRAAVRPGLCRSARAVAERSCHHACGAGGQPEPGGNGASDGRAAEAGAAAVRNGAGGLPAHPA